MPEPSLQEIAETADKVEAGEHNGGTQGAAINWQSASCTDVGRVRPVNEDAFLDSPEQRLWVVADGMGGHSRGDYASGAVVNQLGAFPRQGSILANLRDLEERVQAANDQCRSAFRNKQPGTTVALLLSHGGHGFFLWAGDSRLYRLRDGELEQLTRDHTVAQKKFAQGLITEEEIESHPSAHVLTRAVGVKDIVELDLGYSSVQRGDRYLLCTDGLYNPVEIHELTTRLGQGTVEEACEGLIELAMAGGGRDNITAIVMEAG